MQTDAVLAHFGLERPKTPTLRFARDLLTAYTRHVPWGSASRLARFAAYDTPEARARLADAFWEDVLAGRGDGTCFESNGAFFALLTDLDYDGYLTLNNMQDEQPGCHSAIVLRLDGRAWLVDAGLPIHAILPLDRAAITTATSTFHDYAAVPNANGTRYEIMRSHHGRPHAFTLIDMPVDADAYRARLVRDHQPDGLFLDKLILSRVVDGALWRYNGRAETPVLEEFTGRGEIQRHAITDDLAETLASKFECDVERVRAALVASR